MREREKLPLYMREKVVKDMIQPTVPSRTRLIRRTLLALLALAALWGALVLALSSVPAEADTTFTVNKTGDAGDRRLTDTVCDTSRKRGKQCTLRAAIQEANDTLGTDTINFNIGGTNSVKTISPASELPEITDSVTINGYTQRGSSANTLAVGNDAVLKVQLNGTDAATDTIPNPNGLEISASNSTIKGLVINRFSDPDNPDGNAVLIVEGATNNKVEGNFIGTNASGTQALGNGFAGVFILGASNTVGGTSPAARNVISGNKSHGVLISGGLGSGTGNKVEGNFIGTTANGSGALGNGERGVSIQQSANSNTIGGTATSGAGNVISGNVVSGVQIAGSAGNEVEGNLIGTTADGSGALGNGDQGVFIAAASNNTIGDPDPSDGPTNAANTIAFNDKDGIVISSIGTGNRILPNQFFQNGQVGIDLQGTNDVTANDDDDPDPGPNNLQNFPVITSATRSGSTTTITGTLNSNPSQTYTIQCFLADGDSTNHGEGQIFLAQDTNASTNASGVGSFTCTTPGAGVEQLVTATATNTSGTATGTAIGDTSEFSANFTVGP